MENMQKVDELISAALRGDSPRWPAGQEDAFTASFLVRSEYHGVQALLDNRLPFARGVELGWPEAVLKRCRSTAVIQAVWEMCHQEILNRVLAQLSTIDVRPILFKGSAVAYDIYEIPYLRTRGDTDFLIPDHTRNQVIKALECLGFEGGSDVRGDLNSYQASFTLSDAFTYAHSLDMHWKINNSQLLAKLFSYEELAAEAETLSALGPDAIAVGTIDALLLACMHRAAHRQCPYFVNGVEYYGGDRLIWLYDIHLLLGELQPCQFDEFLARAEHKGLGGVCLEGIDLARTRFNTVVAERVREGLSSPRKEGVASRYLSQSVTRQYFSNLVAVEGMGNKVRFVIQLLFPPEKYMRQRYSGVRPDWLPWLYLRRATIETFKRLHRTVRSKLDTTARPESADL